MRVIARAWDAEYKELTYDFCRLSFDDDLCLCYREVNLYHRKQRPFLVTSMLIQMIGPQNQLFLSPELEPSTEMQFLFSLQLRFSYRDDRLLVQIVMELWSGICNTFSHLCWNYTVFLPSAIPTPMDENNPNLEKGEFRIIQQLVKNLPNGTQIKHEVCFQFRSLPC